MASELVITVRVEIVLSPDLQRLVADLVKAIAQSESEQKKEVVDELQRIVGGKSATGKQ